MNLTRVSVGALLCAAIGTCALARSDGVEAAAEAYVALPAVQALMDDMFDPDLMAQQVRAMIPGADQIPPEVLARLVVILGQELARIRPQLEGAMVAAAAKHFTIPELQAMTAFATSAEGASVLRKTQPYMMDAVTLMGPHVQQATLTVQERLQRDFGR